MADLAGLSSRAATLLKARQDTVAVAESSTGGLISAALLAIPGASHYYAGGSVVYTLASRRELLRLSREDVVGLEPLTEAMVARFAERARQQLDADWGIAELGVAGPTGARYGHAPGLSVIAVDGPLARTITVETGSADREDNMWAFTARALELLERTLKEAQEKSL